MRWRQAWTAWQAARKTIDRLAKSEDGLPSGRPLIHTENRSDFILNESNAVVQENGPESQQICLNYLEYSNRSIHDGKEANARTW